MRRATPNQQRPMQYGLTANKFMFINQLKVKYKNLLDKFQSVPIVRGKHSSSEKICIASGIEFLAGSWESVNSYQDIVSDRYTNSKRRILIGEPGYGKSTIALQYTNDWLQNTRGTYLQKAEVLIFLRLGQMRDVSSIYEAIRKFALPKISTLKEKDVKTLLESSSGVLFILDSFDEYMKGKIDPDSDIMKIMKNEMLQKHEVIFTSGYLPKECPPEMDRFRLTGTDERIQDKYIRWIVANNDVEEVNRIKKIIRENNVIAGMCQIPFFFVMYANMAHHDKAVPKFKTVTNFVRYIVNRFLKSSKKTREYIESNQSLMENHSKLDEIAFEGIFNKDRKITWGKMDLCNKLGVDLYNLYVDSGILIEEDINTNPVTSGVRPAHHRQTEVQFRHRIFCEWYAAHHLAIQVPKMGYPDLIEKLSKVSVCYDQYLYRFVCGVNHSVCKDIIKYVTKKQSSTTILCILELHGQVDDVIDTVNDLCCREIEINKEQNKLQQEAIVQLLRVTLNRKIPVSRLRLRQIFDSVNLSSARSQFHLSPPPIKLGRLTIWESGRVMDESDIREIFEYSSKCIELKEVRFSGCLLPKLIGEDLLYLLQSRNIEVWWFPGLYHLDLESGLWEKRELGAIMSAEEYWKEEQYIQQLK